MAGSRGVKIGLVAGVLGLAAALGLSRIGHGGPELAPDFAVPNLAGQAVRLSGLRGKVVLVNLWTTWCPPCRAEMPSMERLYQRFRGRDFELLAVSQDEDGKRVVEPFVKEMKLSFPVLIDPDHQVGDRYRVWGYPETIVVDRDGHIDEHVVGPREWDSPTSVAQIERLLGEGAGIAPAAARSDLAPPAGGE
jgi:peroxiredoxin